jgi:cytochrome b561
MLFIEQRPFLLNAGHRELLKGMRRSAMAALVCPVACYHRRVSLATILVAVLLVLGAANRAGAGITWDVLNGLGLTALGLLAALHVETLRTRVAKQTPARSILATHTVLAYLAIAAIAIHAAGLLVADPISREYISFDAPMYMAAGYAAAVLLVWITVTSIGRTTTVRPRRFRSLHGAGAMLVLGLSGWHVIGSGFYFDSVIAQSGVLAGLAVCALAPAAIARRTQSLPAFGLSATTCALVAFIALFVLLRNL